MAKMNGSARPAADVTGVFDSGLGAVEGGRAAPRPNLEVLARAKRRTYTGEELVALATKICKEWTGGRYAQYAKMINLGRSPRAKKLAGRFPKATPRLLSILDRAHSAAMTAKSGARGLRTYHFLLEGFKNGEAFFLLTTRR
jgi:hypothetical protein